MEIHTSELGASIRPLVDHIFADNKALSKPHTVRSIYEPTVDTGDMLSIAEDALSALLINLSLPHRRNYVSTARSRTTTPT